MTEWNENSRKRALAPEHAVAVALAYAPDADLAPRVVAGGRGPIAEQIVEIAGRLGIAIRQDQDLCELLSAIDIGSEIPVEAFAAVAEILVYIYRANGTFGAEAARPSTVEGVP